MGKIVSVTTNRQVTLPANLAREAGINPGDKLYDENINGDILLTSWEGLVKDLAGSVEIPDEYKGMDIETLVRKAKSDHFSS